MQETWVQFLGGKMPWTREWQPTPLFLSMENPMDRGPWWVTFHGIDRKESDMTEQLTLFTFT